MIEYLIAIVVILCVGNIIANYNEKARLMKKIPGPTIRFIVGNALEIVNMSAVDVMALGRNYARKFKGIYRFWAFPIGAVNLYNPEDIEVILSNMKYNEKSGLYSFLKPWLGNGLLLSKGDLWQERRKILTPAFHFNILKQFSIIIEENTQRLVEALERNVGKSVDILPILSEYTLNSICETAMGTQLNKETTNEGRSYKEAIYELGQMFFQRFINLILYSDIIFYSTALGKKLKKHMHNLHSFTRRVINDRKEYINKYGTNLPDHNDNEEEFVYKKKRKTAMLDLLIAAEKDGLIDNAGIQEEVDTFMFEGHDTTASGLTFCLMLLANHKDVQDKIVAELNEIFGDLTRPANMNDLSKMRYLECCIKESLRLYPPVHFISRNLSESIKLGNYTLPGGIFCHIHIYDLHRREDLFKNANEFNPDRFLPENSVGRHPYSYIPFSAGPRNCIGQKFAMMEMKLAISEILREFELVPGTRPSDIVLVADLILRNNGPVNITFIKRLQ
ncbi:hypothetical protein K1T71_001827 [Dendrolimus kikuchii]|uniref:Uncharacterized protein n=1 Tax=Dendrolimus kikuchii TaxID=765133 RepID=A0ACC1DFN7_9NEOP|nr:hypothetical protein K1T71_001827 [Dendrolimus kikuchii]